MIRSVVLLLLALAPPASAQPEILIKTFERSERRAWSPEDYARARPFPLPLVDAAPRPLARPLSRPGASLRAPLSSPDQAAPPTVVDDPSPFATLLFDLPIEEVRALRGGPDPTLAPGPEPRRYGDAGLDFTSTRLVPPTAARVYPYSAVGRLFFDDAYGGTWCTAAVIAQRLVLTAAHCLYGGPTTGYFSNFVFVPAYRYGAAPFGLWYVEVVSITQAFADTAEFPHGEDWGLLEIEDRDGVRIGEVTGRLTYQTNALADNELHLLGYPSNLDDGEELHEVTSSDWFDFDSGTVVYGSDMFLGSDGGPWIQNFGERSRGQVFGFGRRQVAVVGVTSYGFVGRSVEAQGSSVLTDDFEALRQLACNHRTGNC